MKSLYAGTMPPSPNLSANAASHRCSGSRSLSQSIKSNFGESSASGPLSLDPSFLCELSGVKTGRLGVGCFRFPMEYSSVGASCDFFFAFGRAQISLHIHVPFDEPFHVVE